MQYIPQSCRKKMSTTQQQYPSTIQQSNNNDVPVIPLCWKDESTDKENTVNVHTISNISTDQNNKLPSKRARRLPTTRQDDFLWLDLNTNQ
jgi:hypothetical protein